MYVLLKYKEKQSRSYPHLLRRGVNEMNERMSVRSSNKYTVSAIYSSYYPDVGIGDNFRFSPKDLSRLGKPMKDLRVFQDRKKA